MDRVTRSLLMGTIFILTFLLSLYVIMVVQSPVVATVSGSEGETATGVFIVEKSNWDVKITYFKSWSFAWSFRIEVYAEGANETPLFSSGCVMHTSPDGRESVELSSHPSLSAGRYYLKIYSTNAQWALQVFEWD